MSGTVVAVYSRVLEPNQDILITEDVTVQITNISLEVTDDKTAETAGRSVLKMQHLEAHPALLQTLAGYDFDDSDSEDGDDYDEEDDDEDDEEDLEADMSKASKASKASTSSNKKSLPNGKAAEEEDEEDDEDFAEGQDGSEDEDEEDFDRQETEVQIASLVPGKIEHITTNLILPGGEDFVFHLSGNYKVHLFGHYIVQPRPPQFDEPPYGESEYDSEDEEIDSDDISDSELEDDEDMDTSGRFLEIEEEPKKAVKPQAAKPVSADAATDKAKLSKNQLKKLAKKDSAPASAPAATTGAAKPAAKTDTKKAVETKKEEAKKSETPAAAKKAPSKKQTLPSGLVLEDNKVGSGAVAKSGQRVSMRYIGRLSNGKIFDQNTKGAPFTFKLGKGEVIKGWDEGIAGMQAGGERRLVIPAKLAYGKSGVEGIPPNSTLTFEVKLLSIK